METLRIAILTETLASVERNLQPWRYLGDLAHSLQREGHEVSVVTSEGGLKKWNDVPVDRHTNRSDFRSTPAVGALVRSRGYDAGVFRLAAGHFFSLRGLPQHSPPRGRLLGIFLRPLHRCRDLARRFLDPTLVSEVFSDRHHAAMCASRKLGLWSRAPSWVDDFVFLWESDRASAIEAGLPPSACSVVRHPFDPFFLGRDPANPSPRLAEALSPASRRIVFSGPPEPTRGFEDVIRLARTLDRHTPTEVLLLLRDPSVPEPTVTLTDRGAHRVAIVRGILTREEIRAAYGRSHVAVFPYRFVRTGLPLVALEAAAAGLPVVTTRVHPIRELEGRSGLVFAEPRNPRALARAVESLFDDARRDETRRKNEAWIRATPDWPDVAKTFASILRGRVAGGNGARVLEPVKAPARDG
ncbi:MAG: glycosyltransferase family 4 protein [Methanobacteriota archaeon]|nr:MAG: glycosyltransferase family 4 protein [Euryarchaeota archaeon]